MAELDSPWKDAIEEDFLGFVAFFFAATFADLDTSQDYESLEQELRKLVPDSLTGKRIADKLVKLVTKGGDVRYLHVEIQGQPDDRFAERMEVYNSRAGEVLGQPVVSVALLVDDDPNWRPGPYLFSCWGCERSLVYPVRKVLDWADKEAALANDPNPFALFVLAHLMARRSLAASDEERAAIKLGLILRLYERKLEPEDSQIWYRLFDWLFPLPKEWNRRLYQQVDLITKEKQVPYVSFAERHVTERTLLTAIRTILTKRYESDASSVLAKLEKIDDNDLLMQILVAAGTSSSLDEVRALLPS